MCNVGCSSGTFAIFGFCFVFVGGDFRIFLAFVRCGGQLCSTLHAYGSPTLPIGFDIYSIIPVESYLSRPRWVPFKKTKSGFPTK